MHQFDEEQEWLEEQMETVHVYVYEEEPKKPSRWTVDHLLARLVQLAAIGMMGAFCLIPYTPAYAMKVLSVPAHFLPVQVFNVQSVIAPTGKTEHPATQAHGTLTIYNGSIFSQALPQGFILTSKDGQEVVTDALVQVPPGNLPIVGMATVSAHAVTAGAHGNIPAGAIQAVYGPSITVKNLSAFVGGQDAYTEQFATPDDTAKALESAREQLAEKVPVGLLASPCTEKTSQNGGTLSITWLCQYVTYTVPPQVKVLSAHVEGKYIILQVRVVVRPE